MITYYKEAKEVYLLKDWKISIYTINIKLVKEVELNFNFPSKNRIRLLKFLKNKNRFQIICQNSFGASKAIHLYEFDLFGDFILKELLSEDGIEMLLEIKGNNLIEPLYTNGEFTYDGICKIYKDKREVVTTNLLDLCVNYHRDCSQYEYMSCLTSTNQKNQLAFTVVHANYGAQGVKIFQLNSSFDLNLIYELDDIELDKGIHNLTFNSIGDKFSLLGYSEKNLSVHEYSIKNNKQSIKNYSTNFNHLDFQVLYTHYLTMELLCIVRKNDFMLFDLIEGKSKEIIYRDSNTDYFVTFNLVIYQYRQKLISRTF